jgi:hypothetical protein
MDNHVFEEQLAVVKSSVDATAMEENLAWRLLTNSSGWKPSSFFSFIHLCLPLATSNQNCIVW